MLARIFSCAVVGLEGVVIEVEVDYTNGLPGMTIAGYLTPHSREAIAKHKLLPRTQTRISFVFRKLGAGLK